MPGLVMDHHLAGLSRGLEKKITSLAVAADALEARVAALEAKLTAPPPEKPKREMVGWVVRRGEGSCRCWCAIPGRNHGGSGVTFEREKAFVFKSLKEARSELTLWSEDARVYRRPVRP